MIGFRTGHDGRACCAALSIDPAVRSSFDFEAFLSHSQKILPKYAVPLFLRFVEDGQAHKMHNNKQNKVHLRREGVDPQKITKGGNGLVDKLFWLPPKSNKYEPFKKTDWDGIVAGKSKL